MSSDICTNRWFLISLDLYFYAVKKAEAEVEGSLDGGLGRATRCLAAFDECVADDESRDNCGDIRMLLTVLLVA